MDGKGKFSFPSGKVYEGDFVKGYYLGNVTCVGLMEGRGVMDYGNGKVYRGEWVAGAPRTFLRRNLVLKHVDGKGVLSQPDCVYQGIWAEGCKKKGKLIWKNGDVYIGRLKWDKLHGPGILACANGDKYDGYWKNNKVEYALSLI